MQKNLTEKKKVLDAYMVGQILTNKEAGLMKGICADDAAEIVANNGYNLHNGTRYFVQQNDFRPLFDSWVKKYGAGRTIKGIDSAHRKGKYRAGGIASMMAESIAKAPDYENVPLAYEHLEQRMRG